MAEKCYVAFDTSNYTTSAALCDVNGRILANLKSPLGVKQGERGLRQSDALFAHIKNLPALCERLREAIGDREVLAVGVSSVPRRVEGSYMPCFLAGVAAAHSFAAGVGCPVYETSHQNGHIMAALYSSSGEALLHTDAFLAFHVSGGTTELLLVRPNRAADDGEFSVELIGETLDINAGQLIDRIGTEMGLKFPCGAEMELLASEHTGRVDKMKPTVCQSRCNMSGAENRAKRLYQECHDRKRVSAFVFDFICDNLCLMARQAIERMGADASLKSIPVLFAGGVMSNKIMRSRLADEFDAYFSHPEFSADNAAGVALICRKRHLRSMIDEF